MLTYYGQYTIIQYTTLGGNMAGKFRDWITQSSKVTKFKVLFIVPIGKMICGQEVLYT